jgi:hypothetical protein
VAAADGTDVVIGKLGEVVPDTPLLPALDHHIAHVVPVGSNGEMSWVDAKRVVTAMQNDHGEGYTMPVIVWLSSGVEVKIEDAVAATLEPSPVGSGITEVWLICRDAHDHAVAKFKWAGVEGYYVTKPEKPKQDSSQVSS